MLPTEHILQMKFTRLNINDWTTGSLPIQNDRHEKTWTHPGQWGKWGHQNYSWYSLFCFGVGPFQTRCFYQGISDKMLTRFFSYCTKSKLQRKWSKHHGGRLWDPKGYWNMCWMVMFCLLVYCCKNNLETDTLKTMSLKVLNRRKIDVSKWKLPSNGITCKEYKQNMIPKYSCAFEISSYVSNTGMSR